MIPVFAPRIITPAPWWLSGAAVDLDFASSRYYSNGEEVDVTTQLACTRACSGYAKNAAGLLVPFNNNLLRITDLGLLVEDARTNLLHNSQDFDPAWVTLGTTVVDNQARAPDGTFTAARLSADAIGGASLQHSPSHTMSTGVRTTVSVFAQKGTAGNYFYLGMSNFFNYEMGVIFNLANGTVYGTFTDGLGFVDSYLIEPFIDNWYRLIATLYQTQYGIDDVWTVMTPDADTAGGQNAAGTGYNYIWGAQREEDATFASSYIRTGAAGVTRPQDAVFCVNALKTALEASSASVIADVFTGVVPADYYTFVGSSGGGDPAPLGSLIDDDTTISYGILGSSIEATLGNSLTFSGGAKVGASWDEAAQGRSVVGGGGTVVSDTVAGNLSPINPVLGYFGNNLSCYYRRLSAFPSRLTNARLQALTAP